MKIILPETLASQRLYRDLNRFALIHNNFLAVLGALSILSRHGQFARFENRKLGPRDFCIRKFFYADIKISASTRSVYESYTTVHTYPIRIRTSLRISQQSMRITKKAEPELSVYKDIRIRASTRIQIHSVYRNFHSGERIQKSPDTPREYGGHAWTLGVSA